MSIQVDLDTVSTGTITTLNERLLKATQALEAAGRESETGYRLLELHNQIYQEAVKVTQEAYDREGIEVEEYEEQVHSWATDSS